MLLFETNKYFFQNVQKSLIISSQKEKEKRELSNIIHTNNEKLA